jgi:polysaccharide biosynthesis protein PslG
MTVRSQVGRWRALIGLAVLLALGVGLDLGLTNHNSPGATPTSTASPSRSTSTTPNTTTPTTADGPAFGLSVPSLVNETPSQQAAALANMKSIGLKWVRVDADWSWLQPTQSTFDWAPLDQEVNSIEAAGMSVDLVIDDTPTWARNAAVAGDD